MPLNIFILAHLFFLFLAPACAGFSLHPSHEWQAKKKPFRKVLVPHWHRPLLPGRERSFNPYEAGGAVALPEKGLIFVGTSAGRFYALESGQGTMVWSYNSGEAINSTPVLSSDGNVVYWGDDLGRFYASDSNTGKLLFSYQGASEIRSRPLISGRVIFFKDIRGSIHAIDATTGKGLWIYKHGEPEGYVVESTSSVALWHKVLIAGFYSGYAAGIDAYDGTEIWRTDLGEFVPSESEIESASGKIDVNTTPVVVENQVLLSSFRGGIYSLDPSNGSILWRRSDIKMVCGMGVVNNEELYVSITNKGLMRLSITGKGQTVWESRFPGRTMSDPVIYKDMVFISDSRYGLIVLDRENGQVIDRFSPMWGSTAPVEVKSGRVFLHSNGGSLYSFLLI